MDDKQSSRSMAERLMPHIPSVSNDTVPHTRDWEYSMRREMQEIIPGLYLGPYAAAMKSKLSILQQHGITHIVCIRQELEANFVKPNFPAYFRYLILDICDTPTENIIQHFRKASDFINDAFVIGGRVLVHGNGGISRSAAIVIAYVMERLSLNYSQALGIVRNQRFCLSVNEGFLQQLMEYEHIYRAEANFRASNYNYDESGSSKRKRELEEEEQNECNELTLQSLPEMSF